MTTDNTEEIQKVISYIENYFKQKESLLKSRSLSIMELNDMQTEVASFCIDEAPSLSLNSMYALILKTAQLLDVKFVS